MSEAAEGQPELVLRDHLLVQADSSANLEYPVLIFLSDLGPGTVHAVPIILLAEVDSKLLVAVPFNSWNRLVRLRLLPPTSFSKVVSVADAAVQYLHQSMDWLPQPGFRGLCGMAGGRRCRAVSLPDRGRGGRFSSLCKCFVSSGRREVFFPECRVRSGGRWSTDSRPDSCPGIEPVGHQLLWTN